MLCPVRDRKVSVEEDVEEEEDRCLVSRVEPDQQPGPTCFFPCNGRACGVCKYATKKKDFQSNRKLFFFKNLNELQ